MDDNIKLIITEIEPENLIVSETNSIVKQKTRVQPILVRPTQSKPVQPARRMGLVFN
jgi:hypothetical protein